MAGPRTTMALYNYMDESSAWQGSGRGSLQHWEQAMQMGFMSPIHPFGLPVASSTQPLGLSPS